MQNLMVEHHSFCLADLTNKQQLIIPVGSYPNAKGVLRHIAINTPFREPYHVWAARQDGYTYTYECYEKQEKTKQEEIDNEKVRQEEINNEEINDKETNKQYEYVKTIKEIKVEPEQENKSEYVFEINDKKYYIGETHLIEYDDESILFPTLSGTTEIDLDLPVRMIAVNLDYKKYHELLTPETQGSIGFNGNLNNNDIQEIKFNANLPLETVIDLIIEFYKDITDDNDEETDQGNTGQEETGNTSLTPINKNEYWEEYYQWQHKNIAAGIINKSTNKIDYIDIWDTNYDFYKINNDKIEKTDSIDGDLGFIKIENINQSINDQHNGDNKEV